MKLVNQTVNCGIKREKKTIAAFIFDRIMARKALVGKKFIDTI